MLKNHKLLIDQHCPMCSIYGQGFTQLGLIDNQTVSPYQQISKCTASHIDMHRAKNEIALFNVQKLEVIYGIDAMIHIVSHNNSLFNKFLCFKPIYWFLQKLYKFVSFNRKVIVPVNSLDNTSIDCTPDVNYVYRWIYILFTALFTGFILNQFTESITNYFDITYSPLREYIICFGQIAWQGLVVLRIKPKNAISYLGNMSTVSLLGGFALLPLVILSKWIDIHVWIQLGYFGFVVGGMLLEHVRRCKLLDVSMIQSISWLVYRTLILVIILSNGL